MRFKQNLFVQLLPIGLIWLTLGACTPVLSQPATIQAEASEAIGSCTLDTQAATDEEAIWALVGAEGAYVVGQEIDPLMRLWAADGQITDAKHTPQTKEDDQNWQGADAIRYRYVRVVFPSAPDAIKPANLNIQIEDQHATTPWRATVTATTQIGDTTQAWRESSSKGDQWQLVKKEGCWLIQSLTFNLEAP